MSFRIQFVKKDYRQRKKISNLSEGQAPSWHQVSTKLALSRHQVKKLLTYCQKERTILEIMKQFQWKDRTKFRRKFIAPLLKEGLLEMTIPGKPNSPNQRYRITVTGKELMKTFER